MIVLIPAAGEDDNYWLEVREPIPGITGSYQSERRSDPRRRHGDTGKSSGARRTSRGRHPDRTFRCRTWDPVTPTRHNGGT